MKKDSFVYTIIFTLTLLFSGCGSSDETTTSNSYVAPIQQSDASEQEVTQLLPPQRAPIGTSFAEDLITYDIGPSIQSTLQETRASAYEDEQAQGEEQSGEDEDSDEDDAEDRRDGDDEEEESSDDDSSDDSSSEEESNDSSSSSSSSEIYNYREAGGFNVVLNNKTYEFQVVYDVSHKYPDPAFEKQLDGTYKIVVSGYVVESDNIIAADGIFTIELIVPSLNLSNQNIPISSNVLTDASDGVVYALVTIKQASEGAKIYLNIVVPEFKVYNRNRDTAYSATFSVGLETN